MSSRLALALFAVLVVGPAADAAEPQEDRYEIGSSDVLRIAIFGQPEMSGEYAVEQDGLLVFPFLGKLKASGLTPQEFERKLTTLLADGYLKRPQVSVSVKDYRSQRVFVTGEVQRPGPYALRADRTLLSLLSDIGNLGPNAGHQIVVVRPPKEVPQARLFERTDLVVVSGDALPAWAPASEELRINLRELQSGSSERNVLLRAGDTVLVPRAAQVYVTGHVARPGPIRFEEGMTVMAALTQAGGVTERGSSGRVRVVRTVDGQKVEVKPKPTDPVQPEDNIVVPERFF